MRFCHCHQWLAATVARTTINGCHHAGRMEFAAWHTHKTCAPIRYVWASATTSMISNKENTAISNSAPIAKLEPNHCVGTNFQSRYAHTNNASAVKNVVNGRTESARSASRR